MNRLAVALLATAAAVPVHAQVYKCRDAGGTTVYSAQPCAVDAKLIDVRPASGGSRQTASATAAIQPPGEVGSSAYAPRSLVQRGNDAALRRMLDDDITRKQGEIAAINAEHEAAQAALREKKGRARNNLAGATWEQSISDEMQAVAAAHTTRVGMAQRELEDMRARRARMTND